MPVRIMPAAQRVNCVMMGTRRNDDFAKIFGPRQAQELNEERMQEEAFRYRSLKANETIAKNDTSIDESSTNTTKVIKSAYIRQK